MTQPRLSRAPGGAQILPAEFNTRTTPPAAVVPAFFEVVTRAVLVRSLAWILGGLLVPVAAQAQHVTEVPVRVQQAVYSVAPTRTGEKELALDLYHPQETPRGAVVLVHGGGFTAGSRAIDENRSYGEALARRGYLAAAISYRLHGDGPTVSGWAEQYSEVVRQIHDPRLAAAIEHFGPAFTDAVAAAGVDEIAAVKWLRRHAPDLGFAPDDIVLFGASAGAITGLTTAYAMGFYGEKSLDVAGVIDLRGLLLRPDSSLNPFRSEAPPLLILHGEEDRRVPLVEAETVFRLAKEAGMPVEFYTAGGYGHDLGGAALLGLKVDRERTVLDLIDAFLKAAFAGETVPQRSLRGRLFPADSVARDPEDGAAPAPASDAVVDDSLFREELVSAVQALTQSVREEPTFVPSLYGLSKVDLLEHPFSDPVRRDWSYWPRARTGLALANMTAHQRVLTQGILSTLLSSKGYLEVNHIMLLEEILAARETSGFVRGAEQYTIAVFGEPSLEHAWGLRFEGHHVSLNITLAPDGVSVTPTFLGASPAPIPEGARAGFNPLVYEQRDALALLASLDHGQRAAAVLAERPLAEVLGTQFQVDSADWDGWRERLSRDGVSASTFDRRQQRLLRQLLAEIVDTYRPELRGTWLDTVDVNTLSFAWMGETQIGRPYYFRIQGKQFVFELDAAQGDGTHVHTVWRDRTRDFGEDLLLEHYRASHLRRGRDR